MQSHGAPLCSLCVQIQALARALDRKVMIYQANTNAVTVGSDGSQAPLHLV